MAPFPVESETRIELIARFNDRHLDFRVSARTGPLLPMIARSGFEFEVYAPKR